jgi:hypothetical protein
MVCLPATSEARARWPRFGLVVVATTSRRDNKDQMIRPYICVTVFGARESVCSYFFEARSQEKILVKLTRGRDLKMPWIKLDRKWWSWDRANSISVPQLCKNGKLREISGKRSERSHFCALWASLPPFCLVLSSS